jgi:hypothetical protein
MSEIVCRDPQTASASSCWLIPANDGGCRRPGQETVTMRLYVCTDGDQMRNLAPAPARTTRW